MVTHWLGHIVVSAVVHAVAYGGAFSMPSPHPAKAPVQPATALHVGPTAVSPAVPVHHHSVLLPAHILPGGG